MNSKNFPVRWIDFVDDTSRLIANCDIMIRAYGIAKLDGEIRLCLQTDTKYHDNQIGIFSYINLILCTLVENR